MSRAIRRTCLSFHPDSRSLAGHNDGCLPSFSPYNTNTFNLPTVLPLFLQIHSFGNCFNLELPTVRPTFHLAMRSGHCQHLGAVILPSNEFINRPSSRIFSSTYEKIPPKSSNSTRRSSPARRARGRSSTDPDPRLMTRFPLPFAHLDGHCFIVRRSSATLRNQSHHSPLPWLRHVLQPAENSFLPR